MLKVFDDFYSTDTLRHCKSITKQNLCLFFKKRTFDHTPKTVKWELNQLETSGFLNCYKQSWKHLYHVQNCHTSMQRFPLFRNKAVFAHLAVKKYIVMDYLEIVASDNNAMHILVT